MDDGDLKTWLSTQTDPMLSESPPDKLAPPCLDPYSVVVLHRSRRDSVRQIRAFQRVLKGTNIAPELFLAKPIPFILQNGLGHSDALMAQFELISCDIVSIYIPDSVALSGNPQYLIHLYNRLSCSREFARVKASLLSLPPDAAGTRFLEQFVGSHKIDLPFSFFASSKKVRIMKQWASSIGGVVHVEQ